MAGAEVIEIRAGAAAHVEPGAALRWRDQIPELLAALEEAFAKVVIGFGLARVEILHPRGVVFAADGLEGEVVENFQIGERQ